jgi:hypothetical protein
MKNFLISSFLLLFTFSLSAQLNSILRNAAKSEGQAIKNAARHSGDDIANATKNNLDEGVNAAKNNLDETAHSLQPGARKALDKAFEKCVDEFYKKINELTEDYIKEKIIEALENLFKDDIYLYEIESNTNYPTLRQSVAKKLQRDQVNIAEVRILLYGRAVQGFKIDADKLFRIYFKMSNTFARDELQKMLSNENCSDDIINAVKSIAERRKISLNYDSCKKESPEEGTDFFYSALGFGIIALFVYAFFRGFWKKKANEVE